MTGFHFTVVPGWTSEPSRPGRAGDSSALFPALFCFGFKSAGTQVASTHCICNFTGASPFFAHPEMGSVRFRVQTMRRRPLPSAARVRPASVPACTPRGTRTPAMTWRRVAWPGISSPPALTRRTPTKRSALPLRRGRRTPLGAYAPSLPCAPPPKWCT